MATRLYGRRERRRRRPFCLPRPKRDESFAKKIVIFIALNFVSAKYWAQRFVTLLFEARKRSNNVLVSIRDGSHSAPSAATLVDINNGSSPSNFSSTGGGRRRTVECGAHCPRSNLSNAAGALAGRLCSGWPTRYQCTAYRVMVVGTPWSAIHCRESARCRQQSRRRDGRAGAAGRVHFAGNFGVQCLERRTVR